MKIIKTDIFGFGIAYETKENELFIHLLFWTFEFKF